MNKYVIPICDIEAGSTWIKVIIAKSLADCKEKLMNELIEYYDFEDCIDYSEFISFMDSQNILIGNIEDIEAL